MVRGFYSFESGLGWIRSSEFLVCLRFMGGVGFRLVFGNEVGK